ncbi:thioredoxin family protein, partial [bacterium]|nr:thioredoxin family protein [bacterium]
VLIAAGTSTRLLPRAGGWMMRVKHFIGFVMLWAGAYFLIPIIGDTAYHLASAVLLIASPVFLGCFDALSAESGFGSRLARVLGILALLYGSYLGLTSLAEVQGRPLGGSAAAQKVGSPFRHATPEDVDAALKGGRPVMVDLTSDDCAICKKLARDVFPTRQVVAAAKPFAALEVNLTRYPKFADRYPGHFPPTLLFFDAKGQRVLTPAIQSLPDQYLSLTADGFAAILKDVAAHLAKEGE